MQQVTMVHCYQHVIESTEFVRRLVGGSRDTSFQLNERQCQILVDELVETCAFLEKRNVGSKFGERVESIILRHLCSAIQRAKALVKKCCCKDLESWLVSAMMLVEIQEEFMAIILDLHLWRMFLDFAIASGRGLSREKKVEEMKIMDEEYHQLFKDLRRGSHPLQQAAVEDKRTIILRSSRIADTHGSTNGLDYLRAIYLHSWLTGSAASPGLELRKCEYGPLLGRGGCGTVMKVKWLGVECALKMLGGQDEKEATNLKGLFHPNIIRLFHYWEDHPENPQSRLLMELMPQDLGAYMRGLLKGVSSSKMPMGKDSVPFSLHVAIDIMYQIAQAMRYMHDKHLTHRDLKPANILVKERPRMGLTCIDGAGYLDIKLADFGLVKSYTNSSTFQAPSMNKGTGLYRAPEVFGTDMTQKRHYLAMADVWSFGITCAEILSGKPAYAEYVDDYGFSIQPMICKEGLRPTLPKHCPEYLAFCIKSCWEYKPSRRPTFVSICKLLRHAQLLSLGVTKLDDSKLFFAYPTQSDQVQSLNLSPSSSRARVSRFFQSSLKLAGIGLRPIPSVAEAAVMHEVRLVPTALITEDSPELNEDTGGGLATPGSLIDGSRHYSAVLPVADLLHEERVVSTPMAAEECPPAHESVALSIATLANPTQVVKSLPGLQERAQLTQASLDNAISPPDASDSIKPGIITLSGRISIMSEKQGRVPGLTKICETGEDALVIPSRNHPQRNPGRKDKKTVSRTSQFQDWLDGQSAEPELFKFRKAASAGNSPAALSHRPFSQFIMLPKPSPPDDLEFLNDGSPRSSIRNNGSREAGGYQFRAPPSGSHQNDAPGPSPKNLLISVLGVKRAVNQFAKVLISNMRKHPVELEYLRQTILWEVTADMDRANHWKFLVQAFICNRLFDGFDAPNLYFDVEYFKDDEMTKLISFADFSKYKDKASTISLLLDSDSPDDSFLGRFCFQKFKSIIGELASNQPLPIYQEEWDAVERECHPKTVFYQSFLKVAVSVWLVHRLVHSFEEKVEMLIYEKGAKFQRQTMESVVPGSYEEEDEEADVNTEVGFSVIPGFQVSRSVVKCEVYLRSRYRHTDMEMTRETSTEKTPVKTAGKSLRGKTSVKLHTPELPVRHSHSFGSLQPPEGFSTSSHYVDYDPPYPRFEVDGSSGLAVREARRDSLTPANQGSVSRSGRRNWYERDNFSEFFPGSHDRDTNTNKMPPPLVRSSNHRGSKHVPRDTKASARRRQESTKHSSPSV